jgi:hypothetical protein
MRGRAFALVEAVYLGSAAAGAELGRSAPGHGALGAPSGSFATFGVGVVADVDSAATLREWLAMLRDALEPHDVGWAFPELRPAYG